MSMTYRAPDGQVRGTDQDVSVSAKSDAPRFVLSYDELVDARQIARAIQGSWGDQAASDTTLACLWPLQQPAAGDQEDTSKATQALAQQTAHSVHPRKALHPKHDRPCSPHEAALQLAQHQRRIPAPKLTGRQSSSQNAKPQNNSSNLQLTEPDSGTDDSIHTAHFSDEGELSDAAITSKPPRMSTKHGSIRQEPVVLYTGPNSKELAASTAASKPPSGPRPRLGDVLLEAIHSDEVKTSSQATGALEEPLPRDKWQCIMRLRQPDGQLVECGYENLWYMRQCVQCDATHGAIELAARVSAILQTCDSSISASQVMNRVKAFSSSPGGLSHAFTMDMVRQAIKDWSLAQGCKEARPSGPSPQNQPAVALLSAVQDQAQVKAIAGWEPAASFSTIASSQQALSPVDEQWGHSAAALQQALITLATSCPTKRLRTPSSLAPNQHTPETQQTQPPSTDRLAEGPADAPALPQTSVDLHAANGSALQADAPFGRPAAEGVDNAASHSDQVHASARHVGAPDAPDHSKGRAQMVETCMWPSEQAASGQALHFAHDLLDAVMRQQHKRTKSSKKRDALGQWVQVRRPSAFGHTQADQHRKVFQLPALPKPQSKLQSWQRPPAPTLSIHYPPPLAVATHPAAQPQALHPHHQHQVHTQKLAEARGPDANPQPMATVAEDEAVDGAAAETLETQEAAEHSLNTSAQDASPQNAPVSPLATTDAAEEATNSYATAAEAADPGGGMVEEPHYASARGLRPNPAARALAGPTVHILLEGYDVYTDSGMKRKGHDFPLQEGLRVSQDSRQLWLHQRPFKLKRATPQDVAEGTHRRGGWRQKQGSKVNTRQIALDRQQAAGGPCSVGASGHPTAFQPFSGLHVASAGLNSGASQPSDRALAPSGQQSSRQNPEAAARQEQDVSKLNESDNASAAVPGQELQAVGQASQSHDEARAAAGSPDRTRAGPGDAVHHDGAVGAADTGSLQAASDTAAAEQFRELGGDAWKVFYMASKMGLRPDVINKAANRLRSLQQQSE